MAQVWAEVSTLAQWRKDNDHWQVNRSAQAVHWFEEEIRHGLLEQLNSASVLAEMTELNDQVAKGEVSPNAAANLLLGQLKNR